MANHKPGHQHDRIIKFLQQGRYLSLINCYQEVGVMALSQRVGELVRENYPIRRETMITPNGARIGKYSWIFPEQMELKFEKS